jgi:ribosomal peptide maturation radical SAM protein 1
MSGDVVERVVLVVPPFQSTKTPALGASLLKANLEANGFASEVLYVNMLFAERIGATLYDHISNRTITLLGDFVFSHLLFEHANDAVERYVDDVLVHDDLGRRLSELSPLGLPEILRGLVGDARDWVDGAVSAILERDPWLVGFSSTFQQNCPSLTLMRGLKARRPELPIAMGGANCAGEMGEELFARFSEIDFLGLGECDRSFVELVASIRHGESAPRTPGFLTRAGPGPAAQPLTAADLEASPHPDFDDYFAQLDPGSREQMFPALVMETSRGCWWGAKQHCTFCGLNADGMAFRSKTGPRALEEMQALVERYGIDRIAVVDNILDMKYFKSLLPDLVESPVAELFYEIKANLTKAQVRSLAGARITWIQPGIESLSGHSLKLMRKGVTELQNVQLLKWCAEVGVHVGWNHLFGFPGEREDEVDQIAHDADAICHLEPPTGAVMLHLDRFSPYFAAPGDHGLEPVYPARPYPHVYPFPDDSLRRLAYFFDSECFLIKEKSPAFESLREIIRCWLLVHDRSHLLAVPRGEDLVLLDTRPCARRFWRRLTGLECAIYRHCDKAESLDSVCRALDGDADAVEPVLRAFVRDKLMLEVDGRYLSLATDSTAGYRDFAPVPPVGVPKAPSTERRLRDAFGSRNPRIIARVLARGAALEFRNRSAHWRLRALRALAGYLSRSAS